MEELCKNILSKLEIPLIATFWFFLSRFNTVLNLISSETIIALLQRIGGD